MRVVALLCSAVLLAAPTLTVALTAAQPPASAAPCLTAREFTALSIYALPSMIAGTTRTCSAVLPAGAFLRSGGDQLAQRYAGSRDRTWPEARAAFLKMTAAKDPDAARLLGGMPDDTLRQLADAAVSGIVSGQIKPASCPTIDRVLALLAPLPAENTGELIAVAVGLGSKAGQPRLGAVTICKA